MVINGNYPLNFDNYPFLPLMTFLGEIRELFLQ